MEFSQASLLHGVVMNKKEKNVLENETVGCGFTVA